MIRILLLSLLALFGACKGDKPAPPAISPPVLAKPTAQIDLAAARDLPNELWFLDDAGPNLVRVAKGAVDTKSAVVDGRTIYLSTDRLADGRIVAIASSGDGRADGEQLVLFSPLQRTITPLGPAAAQVRSPALNGKRSWITAAYTDGGVSNLRLIDLTSQKVTTLTTDPQGNFTPAAVGDEAVVFVSSRDGDSEVYVQNVASNAVTRITAFHREDYDPSADAHGKRLAFVSDREHGAARIFIVSPQGTQLHRLTTREDPAVHEGAPHWYGEDLLAYAITEKGRASIVLRSLKTATERVITPPDASDHEPAFSPTGQYLAVIRVRAGKPAELVVMSTDGKEPERTIARGTVHLPRWF